MNKNSFPKEETEIWGQKTLNNDFTLNERVSVRNLLLEIGDKVNNNLENIEFGKNDPNNLKDQAEKSVNSYLEDLKERKILTDNSVKSELEYLGWRKLYRKFIWAWISYQMIRLFKLPRETTTLKWYHKIFPYRIRHFSLEQIRERMFDEWEEEGHGDFEDWVYTWLSNEENKSVPYVIYFDVPQYVVNTDIYLVPIRSLESIKLNFIIGDEYE